VQQRMAQMSPTLDKADRLAKAMGYDNADALLDAAGQNYFQSEVDRLVNDSVHPEVARDMVTRKLGDLAQSLTTGESAGAPETLTIPAEGTTPSTERDFSKEAADLLSARPDLTGKPLPTEVVRAATRDGKSLMEAYLEYEGAQNSAETATLRKENKILKQNAEAAARSPVTGVSGGGATDTAPEDPFLKGFLEDDW